MTQPHHFAAWLKEKQAEIDKKVAKISKLVYANALINEPAYRLNFEIGSYGIHLYVFDISRDYIFNETIYGFSSMTSYCNEVTEKQITEILTELDKMLEAASKYSKLNLKSLKSNET